jgi:hypothetical protein
MLASVERTTVADIQREELEERMRVAAEVAAVAAELDRQEREELEERIRVAAEVAAVAAELERQDRQEKQERRRAHAEAAGATRDPRANSAAHRRPKLRDEVARSGGGGVTALEVLSTPEGQQQQGGAAAGEVRAKNRGTNAPSNASSRGRLSGLAKGRQRSTLPLSESSRAEPR